MIGEWLIANDVSEGWGFVEILCIHSDPIHAMCFAHLSFNVITPAIYDATRDFMSHSASSYIHYKDMCLPLL
jgi:hypothetical protein